MVSSPSSLHGVVAEPEIPSRLSNLPTGSTFDVTARESSFDSRKTLLRRLLRAIAGIDVEADFLAATLGVLLANSLYCALQVGRLARYSTSEVAIAAALVGLLYVLMLKANGAYTRAMSLLRVRETERVIAASFQLLLVGLAVSFCIDLPISRFVVLFSAVAVPSLVLTEKHILEKLVLSLNAHGYAARKTVIYGGGLCGSRTFAVLTRSPKLGLDPVAVVDDDPYEIGKSVRESAYTASRWLNVAPGPLTAGMLRELGAEAVIISSPSISAERFEQVSVEAALAGATLSFVPHDTITSDRALSYWDADGLIFASIDEQRTGSIYEFAKRIFDLVFTLLILLVLSPALFAIGLVIRWTSDGGALFVQERVGKNGKLFKMYKFRTMYANAPKYEHSPVSASDPRITRLGAFLRRTSLDELPQLLNVLRGQMSLVGPRPEMPFIVKGYTELQRQRLWVKPGITGLWQISADRARQIHENIHYDLYYIRHRSFFMDLAILLHTIAFAMHGI